MATRRTASLPRRTISARWLSRASSTTCEHGGAAGRPRTRWHRPAPLTETMLFRVARTVLQAEQRQYFVVDPPTDLPLPGMLQGRDHWEGILEDQTTQRERNARLPAIAGQVLAAPVSGLAGAVGNVATELGGVRTELAALPERVLMGLAGHFAATTPTSGTADSPAAEPSSITRPSPVVTPAGPGLEAREKIAGVLHNFDVAMSAAVTRNELAEIKKGHQGGKRALVFNQERLWKMWKESGMELDDFLAQEKFANLKTVNAFYNVDRQKRSKKEEQGE
ncbi:hypothetical protein DFJ74DRAFT_691775 [Hyaloraphidium curvatum]|nr:hypothetical protein DFJ74DRAFT_691775 [Hyaloraphidium curvatum]